MLTIKDLHASIDGSEILRGLSLEIKAGEIHAIMGPNGSGKSTLAKVISGHPDYEVTSGEIQFEQHFKKKNVLELDPSERAQLGLFLGFQYPVEIPGITNYDFLKTAFKAVCVSQGAAEMSDEDFRSLVLKKAKELKFDSSFLDRDVNEGFSGGEKKKNEILQMAILNPKIAFLDEIDSGLDIDALKAVADGVNVLKGSNLSLVLVTHYQRLLNYIKPDFVHVLYKGKLIRSGGAELAEKLEERGYDWLIKESELAN